MSQASGNRWDRWEVVTFFMLALATGCWFRLWGLGEPALWLDEFVTLWTIEPSAHSDLCHRAVNYTTHPPIFFAVIQLFCDQVGKSEFTLRLLPAVWDILAFVLLFVLVRMLADSRSASYAMLFYAWSTPLIYQARMSRPYPLAVLFAVILCTGTWQLFADCKPRWRGVALALVGGIGLVQTHYIFLPLLAFPLGLSLLAWHNGRIHAARPLAIASVVAATSLLPLGFQIVRLFDQRTILAWTGGAADANKLTAFVHPGALLVAVLSMGLAGVIWRRWPAWTVDENIRHVALFLAGWFAVPILGLWALACLAMPTVLEARYLVVYAPPCFGLLGLAVGRLDCAWHRWLFVAAYLAAGQQPAQIREMLTQGHATLVAYDLREPLHYLDTNVQKNDLVLIRSGLVEAKLLPRSWNDRVLHSYVAAPLTPFYLSHRPNFRALPDDVDTATMERLLSEAVVDTRSHAGAVWVMCHDGYGGGFATMQATEQALSTLGYQPADARVLGGELVVKFTAGSRNRPPN